MTYTLRDILEISGATSHPSIKMAELIVQNIEAGGQIQNFVPATFLETYFDEGYTPRLTDIEQWAQMRAKNAATEMAEFAEQKFNELSDENSPQCHAFNTVIENFLNKQIASEEAVRDLAKLLAWMDNSVIWGGTAADFHWHTTRVNSALSKLWQANTKAIDASFDGQEEVLRLHVDWLESLANRHAEIPSLEHVEEIMTRCASKRNLTAEARQELTEYAIKLGFLSRDAWWIENHGEITIRGYWAQQIARRAGEGGAKKSSAAKLERIRIFMTEHARIIATNPILRDDPDDQVAHRALKLAISKHSRLFKVGRSKKVAVEYWEYAKADPELREEYGKILKSYT